MQGIQFEVQKGRLLLQDLDNKGTLHISFKPFNKPEINPAFEAWNDLQYAISKGELTLALYGHNTIKEQVGFDLKGMVVLSSCHLYDPRIFNGTLHMVSLKQRSVISDSSLSYIGINRYGSVSFKECNLSKTPKGESYHHSYYRNGLVIETHM
jgi:hypothetical protein